MKLKNSRWTMVMVGAIAFLVLATMVWASPQAGAPSAPLQAYDANNADKVDGLHASKRPKANTLLALRKNKKFPASVIPAAITRDKEVMGIVKNSDGAGSGLDADLLDGQEGAQYLDWNNLTNVPACFADGADDDTLAGLSCGNSQVAKWNDTATQWECGDDEIGADGVGDITAVTAGTGLSGGGETGDVTLDADTTYLQRRVGSTCAAGTSIRVIGSNGSVTCEPDDNTTYSAGDGLNLSGTTFRIRQDCANNQVVKWNGSDWVCAVDIDTDTTYTAGNQLDLVGTRFDVIEGAASGLDADLLDGQHASYFQRRVSDSCVAGSHIRAIGSDGTVTCENDRRPDVVTSSAAWTEYLTNTCANYNYVTMYPTGPGLVRVEANVKVRLYHSYGTSDSLILGIGTTDTDCGYVFDSVQWDIPSTYPDSSQYLTFTVQSSFGVTGAGTYTYYLNGYMSEGYSYETDVFWAAYMEAIFYPD